jgi:RecJ-like exonuclease
VRSEILKCKNCNERIETVKCHVFDREGGDSHESVPIQGGGRWGCYYITVSKYATMFEFEGYIDEFKDNICCPKCDKFPFGTGSVSIHEHADVVFGVSEINDFE